MKKILLVTQSSEGYELLDSGEEAKLERFGPVVLRRPDPQALWPKRLSELEWGNAAGEYVREGQEGRWKGNIPQEWQIKFGGLEFLIRPTSFKHTGLFPEQLPNWEWMGKRVVGKGTLKILNLFAYTGGATMALAQAGAEVTHVDASKTAVAWARENAKISGLEDKPIRWIIEDVLVYVRREVSRGVRYDAIVMDPPAFGRGPKNEVWKIEENLLELIKLCRELLSENPLFFLINGYASGYSPLAFAYNLEFLIRKYGGEIEYGDLAIEEKGNDASDTMRRLLPAGIFARWCSAN